MFEHGHRAESVGVEWLVLPLSVRRALSHLPQQFSTVLPIMKYHLLKCFLCVYSEEVKDVLSNAFDVREVTPVSHSATVFQ